MGVVLKAELLGLVLVLAGCGSGSGDPDPNPTTTAPVAARSTWTPDPSQCEDVSYGLPLEVSTAVEEEVAYLENVVACAADQQYGPLWLHNIGDEAWVLNARISGVDYLSTTRVADLLASGYPTDLLLLPGDEVVINQPPAKVSWDLSAVVTVAWEIEGEALDEAESLAGGILERELRKEHPKGAAILACALAAGGAAETAEDQPDEFDELLESSLGLAASSGKCATGWKSVWQERFAPATEFLEHTESQFRIYNRLARILKIAVH